MLKLPKKNLIIANIMLYLGMACIVVFIFHRSWVWIVGCFVLYFTGIAMKNELFRCPKCHNQLLNIYIDGKRRSNLINKFPERCPHCDAEITVEWI